MLKYAAVESFAKLTHLSALWSRYYDALVIVLCSLYYFGLIKKNILFSLLKWSKHCSCPAMVFVAECSQWVVSLAGVCSEDSAPATIEPYPGSSRHR